jgi:YXWGXW repeat-containing protein
MTNISASAGFACTLVVALGGCVVTPYDAQPAPADSPPATYQSAEQASEPPPPLPVYEQPPCPEEGYIWTPGVWRWGPQGYFWVPGTWVAPPAAGMLWTPGYWASAGAVYVFHPGYWGRHVGYYGGINYGQGYTGEGYAGGRWEGDRFRYNTAVTNVNTTIIHNTYNETVINNVNTNVTRLSHVGAPGTRVQPTRTETVFAREPRAVPTPSQLEHHNTALTSPQQYAARNEGRPPVAATPHANAFTEHGVTAAKPVGPAYHPQQPPGRPDKPQH